MAITIDPKLEAPLRVLTAELRNKDKNSALEAAHALWNVEGQRETALAALLAGVSDRITAGVAVIHLEDIGPDAKAAVPALKAQLWKDRRNSRWMAQAIQKIAPGE